MLQTETGMRQCGVLLREKTEGSTSKRLMTPENQPYLILLVKFGKTLFVSNSRCRIRFFCGISS